MGLYTDILAVASAFITGYADSVAIRLAERANANHKPNAKHKMLSEQYLSLRFTQIPAGSRHLALAATCKTGESV